MGRGTIKKALRPMSKGYREGSFRGIFEDKLLLSDIVFLRAWVTVFLPKLYIIDTNPLGKENSEKKFEENKKSRTSYEFFNPTSSFDGEKKGYVFKTGGIGTGLYADIKKIPLKRTQNVITKDLSSPHK